MRKFIQTYINQIKYFKRNWPKIMYSIIAIFVAIITLLFTYDADIFKKLTMSFSNVPEAFILKDELLGTYNLYYETLEDNIDLNGTMATTINVTNTLSKDIQLNKFIIDISNIKVDEKAYFYIFAVEKDDGIYLQIFNCGWGDAENISFIFESDNSALSKYIGSNTIEKNVEIISAGKMVEIPFLLETDFEDINEVNDLEYMDFTPLCLGDNISIDSIKYSSLYIGISNGQLYAMGGVGGSGIFVYGINFETSKKEYSYERSILEEVSGGEIKILPICLYPDKSCTFDLKIGFQYLSNGKLHNIYCKKKNIRMVVNSAFPNEFLYNVNEMTQEEIQESIMSLNQDAIDFDILLSYPYVNIDNLYVTGDY